MKFTISFIAVSGSFLKDPSQSDATSSIDISGSRMESK